MATPSMTLVVAALLVGCLQLAVGQGCSRTEISPQLVEACVNTVRGNYGQFASEMCGNYGAYEPLAPFALDPILTRAADGHSLWMASPRGAFNHGAFGNRIKAAGYQGSAFAENIAMGQRSAFEVVKGWMCSKGHRDNLLSCAYDSFGTGVRYGNPKGGYNLPPQTPFITQNYGCSSGQCCPRGGGGGGSLRPAFSGNTINAGGVFPTSQFGGSQPRFQLQPGFRTTFSPQRGFNFFNPFRQNNLQVAGQNKFLHGNFHHFPGQQRRHCGGFLCRFGG